MLNGLTSGLSNIMRDLGGWQCVNKDLVLELIKKFSRALMEADVHIRIVQSVQTNIEASLTALINANTRSDVTSVKRAIYNAIYKELVTILSTDGLKIDIKKESSSIAMFVGLQGAGKTTTLSKIAFWYKQRGYTVGVICADTFRAGAYDQLRQNCKTAKVEFYGSTEELNPMKLAIEGVEYFKKKRTNLILVDTSGRHKQESSLLHEMNLLEQSIQPNFVVYVMDSHIGQSCYDQALAFKSEIRLDAIVITKLDGHVKGGGAISSVAAAGCPIWFIGTGEHLTEIYRFTPERFVRRLMGGNDFFESCEDSFGSREEFEETQKRAITGKMNFNDFRNMIAMMTKFGGIAGLMKTIPGLGAFADGGDMAEGISKLESFISIIDAMTPRERSLEFELGERQRARLAQGAGCSIARVDALLAYHDCMKTTIGAAGKQATKSAKNLKKGKRIVVSKH